MAGGVPGERTLQETPTWAVAVVIAVFIIVSVLIEQGIHSLEKWFQKRHKKAMSEALEKIKAELMLLGFISLLLTFGTNYIAKICIPEKLGDTMLPCKKVKLKSEHRRRLLSFDDNVEWRRVLAATTTGVNEYCSKKVREPSKLMLQIRNLEGISHNIDELICILSPFLENQGRVPLISQSGVHQLHIFIFVLAVFHIFYSVMTMALARAKMNKWKAWEAETSSQEYQFTNDPARFRFTHQTSFVMRHSGKSRIRWIVAFFRQFFSSVTKVDYMTMRHGFINAHFAPNSKFDFHKYIKRSMEDDFKMVVGISLPLWVSAILFMLLNVYKWYTLTWLAFAPLVILLLVGMKLELIIKEMAQEIQDRATILRGVPVVEPNNKYFWFNRPQWILFLIHFTLFENAFQVAYFLWSVYEYRTTSCFHENLPLMLTRVIFGILIQFLCSYISFPLYSLVTQMGSHMKRAIFEEQTAKALKKWQKAAKEKRKLKKGAGADVPSSGYMSGETTPSQGTSPVHLLHKSKPSHTQTESVQYNTDLSETEGSELNEITLTHQAPRNDETHNIDFSYVKP